MTDDAFVREVYLDLLKRSLLGLTVGPVVLYEPIEGASGRVRNRMVQYLRRRGRSVMATPTLFDLSGNVEGRLSVWHLPPWVQTMVGRKRLDNVEACVRSVVNEGIPGDLIETGVWRGGVTILMRGVLRAYGDSSRKVVVADSFEGVPPPDAERYPADTGMQLHLWPGLQVSRGEVQANFARHGLLDDQVEFVEGWFRDTLPGLRNRSWSIVRLDGDLYESTMDCLTNLYPGLSPGGWLIVDDFGEIPACKQAVLEYREAVGITEPIVEVDHSGICWQKRR